MTDGQSTQRDFKLQDEGQETRNSQWPTFHESTRMLLEEIAKTSGEELAWRVAEAIQLECDGQRYGIYEPQLKKLQQRLEDALIVLKQQERERRKLKATKLRRRIKALEQECARLQAALDRKPTDEATERTARIEALMEGGEQLGYPTLSSFDGVLVEGEFESYCTFCSTASWTELQEARDAMDLVRQARAGRKK